MTERHNDSKIVRSDNLPPEKKEDFSSRRSVRVDTKKINLILRYKFLSTMLELQCSGVFEGEVLDLSKGGAHIRGKIPSANWLILLGSGKVFIGCNIILDSDTCIKTLTKVRWARPTQNEFYNLGLEFLQMPDDQRQTLNNWLLRQQIKSFRLKRRDEMLKAGEV